MATALEDLKILQSAEAIADEVWKQVTTWPHFPRSIVGGQLARAADSIGANIAEAFGRYHYGEKLHHLYIARGSLFETKYWLNRCESRKLLSPEAARQHADQLTTLAQGLNSFARSLRAQMRSKPQEKPPHAVREESPQYSTDADAPEPLFSEADLALLRTPISNL